MSQEELKEIENYFKNQITFDNRLSPDYADSFRCAELVNKLIKELSLESKK
ncbi:hypothetical protein GW796_09065 [archaeon]|nr:hypothetical protein [archaeon]NCT58882.1 hypothetical protein [archaeon]